MLHYVLGALMAVALFAGASIYAMHWLLVLLATSLG